jgi:seryl-tRNA synthetase
MPEQQNSKLPIIIASVIIAGIGAVFLNRSARDTVKEKSSEAKETASQYKENAKNSDALDKDDFMARIQNATELAKTIGTQLQDVYNNYGKDLIAQVQKVKDDSEEVVSTAKEAGEELKGVGDTAKDAGEELKEAGSQVKEAKDEVAGSDDDDNDTKTKEYQSATDASKYSDSDLPTIGSTGNMDEDINKSARE